MIGFGWRVFYQKERVLARWPLLPVTHQPAADHPRFTCGRNERLGSVVYLSKGRFLECNSERKRHGAHLLGSTLLQSDPHQCVGAPLINFGYGFINGVLRHGHGYFGY